MEVLDDLTTASLCQETVLTIGAFDGVHRGHQALIQSVVARARETDRLAALLTFHPRPAAVLSPSRSPRYLTTPGEKVALLEALGLDLVALLQFDLQMAATPARDFLQTVCHHLKVRELWVGIDFSLGRNREGNVPYLRDLGRELGFELHTVEAVIGSGEVISSSRIRVLLAEGAVGEAGRLLGRYPSLSGVVVAGVGRGRGLGFPTANLEVHFDRAVPANGAYAVWVRLGSERHAGVANVGVRPSFDNGQQVVEIHILDFGQEIYGCDLVVEFVAWLRAEQKFEAIDHLVAQIARDSAAARRILTGTSPQTVGARVELAIDGRSYLDGCPYGYQEIEHTADRALRVWGRELPDLFVAAARGMYSLLSDGYGSVPTTWREISLVGWDQETLLVDWLNELLYLTETEHLLFVDYEVESLTATALMARVGGVPGRVTRTIVKAATFHDLALVQDDDKWSAVITFDV